MVTALAIPRGHVPLYTDKLSFARTISDRIFACAGLIAGSVAWVQITRLWRTTGLQACACPSSRAVAAGFHEACSVACQGLRALDDWAGLGDGLGGHGDEAVAGTDADGTGWPVHERTARAWPLVPVMATAAAPVDVGRRPEIAAITARIKSHNGELDSSAQPGSDLPGG